jgi:hypothetical protein
MHAHAEPIAWAVRIYESDEGGFARKETWVASCIARAGMEPLECEVNLQSIRFGFAEKRAVMALAKLHGFEWIVYTRRGKKVRRPVR